MQKTILFLETYAPSVLRYGVGAVVVWFGLQQLVNAQVWMAYVPDFVIAMTHVSAVTVVYLNGIFELIFGVLFLFGWQTRGIALLLALHLFDIMFTVGYGEIGVRDFGLAVATLVVCMNGSDPLCIQQKRKMAPINQLN